MELILLQRRSLSPKNVQPESVAANAVRTTDLLKYDVKTRVNTD